MLETFLAGFIVIESFAAADSFNQGERVCRFAKYCMSLVSAICVLVYQLCGSQFHIGKHAIADITIFALLVTLALFFWPRVLNRIGFYKRRIGD